MTRLDHDAFWTEYAMRVQPEIERLCRTASRVRTGNGLPAEDMMAWVDDKVWRLMESRAWPIFHDDPAADEAVARATDHAPLLVRWAYLALARRHFRTEAKKAEMVRTLGRAERLAAVNRAQGRLERSEQLAQDLGRLRSTLDDKTRARLAATWQDRAEARRIALALDATDPDADKLIDDVSEGTVKQNTIDQMRSRSRAAARSILGGKIVTVLLAALMLLCTSAARAGEQTGGRGGKGGKAAPVCAEPAPLNLLAAEEQTGGRGG